MDICKQCGKCCKIFQLPIENNAEAIRVFEKHFGFKLKEYNMTIVYSGECEHLTKDGKCSIYKKQDDVICGNQLKDYFCGKYKAGRYGG